MSLGKRIQSLRESCGFTQKELAGIIGVSTGTIAEWEADETAPQLAAVAKLSKAFGVSADVLLEDITEITETKAVETEKTTVSTKSAKKKLVFVVCIVGFLITALLIAIVVGNGLPIYPQGDENEDEEIVETLPFSQDTAAIEAADASVVTLFCYDYEGELAATGSGFVAFNGKTIITNYHVMTSAYTCKISTNQDISYEVSHILCYSKEKDIAILELFRDTGLEPLILGDSSIIKKGETVVAIGSPLGIKNTVSSGILSGRLMKDNMDVLQFTAPISSGSSGGALFDDNGNVIGITYASYVDGQNLNLAIPIELANDLYNSKGATKTVSAICKEEYPYIEKLNLYKDIPEITIDQLLANPVKYDGKMVKLYGYLSSVYSYMTPFDELMNKYGFGPHWTKVCYIATENSITGNSAYDDELYSMAENGRIPHQVLKVTVKDEDGINYLSDDAEPGDILCWIGKISGEERSDGSVHIYLGDSKLIYHYD